MVVTKSWWPLTEHSLTTRKSNGTQNKNLITLLLVGISSCHSFEWKKKIWIVIVRAFSRRVVLSIRLSNRRSRVLRQLAENIVYEFIYQHGKLTWRISSYQKMSQFVGLSEMFRALMPEKKANWPIMCICKHNESIVKQCSRTMGLIRYFVTTHPHVDQKFLDCRN